MNRSLYTLLCIVSGILLSLGGLAAPTANFSSNIVSGCSPILVQFTDQSTGNPTSWSWNLGNSTSSTLQNPSTTYITPGNYTVTLTVSNASGTNTKTIVNYITVTPIPIVHFTANDTTTSCPPKTVQFSDLTNLGSAGAATYFWDFGDGTTSALQNPSHTYTATGNYNVTLNVVNANGCSQSLVKNQYIKLTQKPVANFTAPNANSCTSPLTVNFNNTTTGAISYSWDFGDGGTSSGTNPSHNYTTPGSYTVILVATNAGGCKDTVIKPAFVSIGSLSASFTKSTNTTCTGNLVNFTNTSFPGPGNATWYFGDGGSATTNSAASHAYAAAGTYTIKLVVHYNNCSDSATSTINVVQGPNAQFTATPLSSCSVPMNVQFTNNSSGANSYLWKFGDGTTSTATNPSHTYTTLGNKTVTLIGYSAGGCSDTIVKNNYIKISVPALNVSSTILSNCAPTLVSFTANSSATITNYTWNFGDGTVVTGSGTMTHTYTSQGAYVVTVIYTTSLGCTDTSSPLTINVGALANANLTIYPTTVCPGQTATYTNNSIAPAGTSYLWIFGDGDDDTTINTTHSYGGAGIYSVMLIATNNGCSDTATGSIVATLPTAAFSHTFSCTNRKKVTFTDLSIGANSWLWDFGDSTMSTQQNPIHVYNTFGPRVVTLTVHNNATGCNSTFSVLLVTADLDAQFAADDSVVCKGQPVNFTAQSGTYYLNYAWDFGDGVSQASPAPTISHTYTTNGIYTVRLIVSDATACKDTMIKVGYIHVSGPTADFTGTPTSGCAPLTVNFTDQSQNGGSAIVSRAWRFGDGVSQAGNLTTTSHTYGSGTFSVRLIATSANGCADTLVRSAYINASTPTAAFTASDTLKCAGLPINFLSASGNNVTYAWQFGDGGTATAANPSHTYAAPGYYTVTLIVTSNNTSCKDTLVRTNYIHILGMNLAFTLSDTLASCPPLSVSFVNNTVGSGTYTWSFGNGNASSLPAPTTIYTMPGTYTVTLKGQNSSGCMDSLSKTVKVLGPTGTFSYTPVGGCAPLTVQLSSVNTNTQLLIWDMNNGVTLTTSTSSTAYTYTQPGVYLPKLLLSDGSSCIVPVLGVDTIRVGLLDADFSFSPDSLCQSGTVSFTDTVLFSISAVASRSWKFGDGGTSTQHNPTHFYNVPGSYTVTLILNTQLGCHDTIVKTVTVLAPPQVSAGNGQSACQGQAAQLQLQASGASNYSWTPTTGLSCTNCPNPLFTPGATTTFSVVGTDVNGCMDTGQVTITVNPQPNVTTGPAPTICSGSSIQLGAGGAQTYVWSPAATLSCTNCAAPTANPSVTTTYTVIGTAGTGCSDTNQVTVNVVNLPVVDATASDTVICAGASSQLQASGSTTYSWFPTAGLSCVNCANPVATPSVTTTYIVSGTSGNNCTDTAAVTITVNQQPVISAGGNQSLCIGASLQLQSTGGASYTWSPSTGLSCVNCPDPIVNPVVTTTYTIVGTTANGCTDSGQITLTVDSLPVIVASNPQTICLGSPTSIQVGGAQSYQWSPAAGLSCTNCANPNANPGVTTTYTVIGTDGNGCKDTTEALINVNGLPTVDAGPDVSICKLGTVQLQAAGAAGYSWTPSSGLSCTSCPDPVATPINLTTYTVTGTDTNGCANTDDVQVAIYPQPVISAGSDATICSGQPTQLTATGGVSYSWTPAANLSCINCDNPLANPQNDIVYTVIGTDANGCSDSDQVTVSVIQMLPFTVGPGDTLCQGESAQLFASGGQQYQWLPTTGLNNPNIPNPVATPEVTTAYMVVMQQGSCFSDTGKVLVLVHPQPTVNAGGDQTVLAGSVVHLFADATNANIFKWTPADFLSCDDCASPSSEPKRDITYKVVASNEFGCEASDEVSLFVLCDKSLIFLANTFTPNADGNNDRFYPQGKGVSNVKRFRIFSRWGEVIYDAQNIPLNDESFGWDGTYKGESLKPDVYVYLIDALCDSGLPIQIKGDISLIR